MIAAKAGAAGGDQIVHDDDGVAFLHRVGVDFDAVLAVFEIVILAQHAIGQLALLADRHEADAELMRHRAAENEPARLDARDLVDLHALVGPTSSSTAARNARASPNRVVMSRNMIPGLGNPGWCGWRI